jgi:hypothetical protein
VRPHLQAAEQRAAELQLLLAEREADWAAARGAAADAAAEQCAAAETMRSSGSAVDLQAALAEAQEQLLEAEAARAQVAAWNQAKINNSVLKGHFSPWETTLLLRACYSGTVFVKGGT